MSGNPCDECLVKPSCTSVCPDKENYGVFLEMGERNLNSSFGHYRNKRQQIPASIQKQIKIHKEKVAKHQQDIIEITRKNGGERLYQENHRAFPHPILFKIKSYRKRMREVL